MHIFRLELKRLLKTRRIVVMLIASVVLSVLMAFMTVQGVTYNDPDARQLIGGREAIDALSKEDNDAYVGPVTVEKLQRALKTFHDVYQKYGQNIPADVYRQKISPIQPFLDAINAVYFPNESGYQNLGTMNPDRLQSFYTQRFDIIKSKLEGQYSGNQSVLRQAEKLNAQSKVPFIFAKGDPSGTAMSLTFLAFLLVAIGAMITAPNFATEYQSGADDILRSTKHGRRKFVVIKLFASLVLLAAMFLACSLIFILLVNNTVGWNSFQTSMQFSLPTNSLAPLSFLQGQFATLLATLLSLLATACLSLFISTKCRNSTTALILSITIFMLPIMLEIIVESGGNISGSMMAFFADALPGGSVGIQGNFYRHLLGVSRIPFVQIGAFSVWTPYLMLSACSIEILVFFLLAVHSYCRHQAT